MNKPKIAVWQHYLGIGDLVWHIPYIRELAKHSHNNQVYVITRPSSMPYDLLAGEESVAEIILFDRKPRKSENRNGIHDGFCGALKMAKTLEEYNIDEIYIFSSRARAAYISKKARIGKRAGFGFTALQRLFLNHPPYFKKEKYIGSRIYDDATKFMKAHGIIDEAIVPKISVDEHMIAQMAKEYTNLPKPWFGFSIGASDGKKSWKSESFSALSDRIIEKFGGTIFLLGGKSEKNYAQSIVQNSQNPENLKPVLECTVYETAALLRSIDFVIGNDTGALNLSAANDVPTLGLFGATLPLKHDPILYGLQKQGMSMITVDEVFNKFIELYQISSVK